MAAPVAQMPWVDADSQVSGTSHQRGRRSWAVRHQAASTGTSSTKPASCGRSVSPGHEANTATAVTSAATQARASLRAQR